MRSRGSPREPFSGRQRGVAGDTPIAHCSVGHSPCRLLTPHVQSVERSATAGRTSGLAVNRLWRVLRGRLQSCVVVADRQC
jgi:hypothetical protein